MLFRMSAGVAFLTVLMSLGIQYRLVYLYLLGILPATLGGPIALLLGLWETCRYGPSWRTTVAVLIAAVSSALAWATGMLILTGHLW